MRNKLFILGAFGLTLIVVVVLVLLFVFGGSATQTPSNNPSFGDASGERPFDTTTGTRPGFGTSTNDYTQGGVVPVLRALTIVPVSGAVVTLKRVGDFIEPYARYSERETGHVQETSLMRLEEAQRVSSLTVPRVQEALWSSTGSSTMYRYLDTDAGTIFTWIGDLIPTQASSTEEGAAPAVPYELKGKFLAENIIDATYSPDGSAIFYLVPSVDEGSIGYVESRTTNARRQIWKSPLRELTVDWPAQNTITIATNPSAATYGYVWSIDVATGVAQPLLTGALSLTAKASVDGMRVLYSTLERELPSLRVLDIPNAYVSYQSVTTLPEKCVWSKRTVSTLYCAVPTQTIHKSDFPELWYQGRVTFSDVIWRIDATTGTTELIADPSKLVDRQLDAVDLVLDVEDRYLVFKSRQDGILWSLQLPATDPTAVQATTTSEGGI